MTENNEILGKSGNSIMHHVLSEISSDINKLSIKLNIVVDYVNNVNTETDIDVIDSEYNEYLLHDIQSIQMLLNVFKDKYKGDM